MMTQVIRPMHSASKPIEMHNGDEGEESDQFDVGRQPPRYMAQMSAPPPVVGRGGGGGASRDRGSLSDDGGVGNSPRSLRNSSGGGPSPRCEAFVMTGEKMLRLDSKISPSYAKIKHEQLIPADSAIAEMDASNKKRGPFDDFPSMHHKVSSGIRRRLVEGVPNSQSEHALAIPAPADEQLQEQDGKCETEEVASSVTVNALCSATTDGSVQSSIGGGSTMASPTSPYLLSGGGHHQQRTRSVPNSPLKSGEHRSGTADVNSASPLVITVNGDATAPSTSGGGTPVTLLKDGRSAAGGTAAVMTQRDAAARLAKRLFTLDGFRKSDVAAQLAKNNEFGARVAEEYLQLFNFGGLRLDAAVRKFLSKFSLTGESQERERVLVHFSHRYHHANPALFDNTDEVHSLTCAILLLNTDLHGPNLRKRMTCREFIDNLANTGYNYKRDLLKNIYASIKETPIDWAHDSPTSSRAVSSGGNVGRGGTLLHSLSTPVSGQQYSAQYGNSDDPEQQVEYKKGWVMRKCLHDGDGKRTPFGRRGWRMFYATLKGMVLYMHKDEKGFRRGQFQTFQNSICIHHALATPSQHYKKRKNVFAIRTANLGEYLCQTSDPNEVRSWCDTLNFVAASFSAPALPAPCSSAQAAFHRPLLPSARTHLPPEEQLKSHERKVVEMEEQLESLKRDAPPLTAKGAAVQRFFYKERYLEEEKLRYSAYVSLLRAKLTRSSPTSVSSNAVVEQQTDVVEGGSGAVVDDDQKSSDRLSYRAAIGGPWIGDVVVSSSQESSDYSANETDIIN